MLARDGFRKGQLAAERCIRCQRRARTMLHMPATCRIGGPRWSASHLGRRGNPIDGGSAPHCTVRSCAHIVHRASLALDRVCRAVAYRAHPALRWHFGPAAHQCPRRRHLNTTSQQYRLWLNARRVKRGQPLPTYAVPQHSRHGRLLAALRVRSRRQPPEEGSAVLSSLSLETLSPDLCPTTR